MAVNLDAAFDPRRGLSDSDPALEPLFRNLQGNILKGHGRDFGIYAFIEFRGDRKRVGNELAALCREYVTSMSRQLAETEQFKRFGVPGRLFGSLFLTAKGYRVMGFDEKQLQDAFRDEFSGPGDVESNFLEGAIKHRAELGDPDPNGIDPLLSSEPAGRNTFWEEGYRDGRIDAMVLLADDDEMFLLREARALVDRLTRFSAVLAVEVGRALRNTDGEGIEHFGYVDGRSQPVHLTSDLSGEGATDRWNPVEHPRLVLREDKLAGVDDAFGSFLVFRKLEQDVLHFKMKEQELADHLGFKGEQRKLAGAFAVGRFEDGTPVAVSQTDGFRPEKENNFTYDIDPEGMRCPFHAHIRKANPRGDIIREFFADDPDPAKKEEEVERRRRVTRRGITYGRREMHPNEMQGLDHLPIRGVGLLFMCFQESIRNQFAFMQKDWCNSESFLRAGTGLDAVIGQKEGSRPSTVQEWPVSWGAKREPANLTKFTFEQFVRMRGGEFFFAPSIPFLESLGKAD